MTKRTSTGKRQRFEIFKRDGFRCTYCGATPVQKVLRVDHVIPVAKGGQDGPDNLVTSCFDCNAGKAAVPLDERKLKVGLIRDEDREHAEQIHEYLALQRDIHGAKQDATKELGAIWEQRVGPLSQNMFSRLPALMKDWPHERLIEAIDITAGRLGTPGGEYDARNATNQVKYFHGVLRRFKEDAKPPTTVPAAAAAPSTPHQKRAFHAVCVEVAKINAALDDYPTTKSRRRLIYEAFVVAARGSEEDLEWAVGSAWEYETLDIRGLLLEAVHSDKSVSYRVTDSPGFNPYKYAYDELQQAVSIGLYPALGRGEHNEAALRTLNDLQGELYVWLSLYLEDLGDPDYRGALASHRQHHADGLYMKRWRLI